ncbi:MAG TPA: hypothetical protein VFN55_05545 [Solirubrobacteraceae bacterium]|nr:hypothetical protein [Solirubrobacteraceae bacterium]
MSHPVNSPGTQVSVQGLARASRTLPGTARRVGPLGPILFAGLLTVALVAVRLAHAHGNVTAFIEFGRHFASVTRPPRGAVIATPIGYDGQFFWVQALDPFVLHHATVAAMDTAGRAYELQRMAYPLLAAALALGQPGAIPWTLLVVNIAAIVGVTGLAAAYAQSCGRSVWWGVAVGCTPGMVMGTLRDLSDPLATAAVIGALITYAQGRRWWAAGLLALAVLAREPMVVAFPAIGVDILVALWWGRRATGRARWAPLRAWPVLVIPLILFVAWQLYVRGLSVVTTHGGATHAAAGSDTASWPPFNDVKAEIQRSAAQDSPAMTAWDVIYMALVIGATLNVITLLRRAPRAASITALLSGLIFGIIFLGDQWGVSRYGAPVLGAAVIAGLQLGRRGPPRWGAIAVAMTFFAALVIPNR